MNAVNPLARISTLPASAAIAEPQQSLDAHADLLAKGQSLLRSHPLQKAVTTSADAITDVSLAAHLIDESLQKASAAGINAIYQAKNTLGVSPKIPAMMAEALKQAIDNSGLFYESHLRHFVEGRRNIGAILQEPQNSAALNQNQATSQTQSQSSSQSLGQMQTLAQNNPVAQALLPQQLAILEHQRINWQGEVWPNQQMHWQTHVPTERNQQQHQPAYAAIEATTAISSDITLHLPHLGKVTAKLQLNDGHVRISMLAENTQTLATLKAQSKLLINAMQDSGQQLEALTVTQDG